jgi:hypothetical protein
MRWSAVYARCGAEAVSSATLEIAEPHRAMAWWSPRTTVDGGSCVKKIMKQVKPIYALPVVIVLIGAGFIAIFVGDDEGKQTATTPASTSTRTTAAPKPRKRRRPPKPAPIGTTGVIDEARREGPFVVAQARGTIRNPGLVRLRVSASPRQRVTVDWQLSCFRNRQVRVGKGKYRTRAPDTRAIQVPMSGAESCIAIAGAQLTRYGKGRVKVAVIAG